MKNKVPLLLAAALLLFSCTPGEIVTPGGNTPEDKPTTVSVTGVTLDKTSLTLKAGESVTLIATVEPDNATNKAVSWSSRNKAVATVDDNGKVTGIKTGTATITAITQDGGKKATCAVTVTSAPSAIAVDMGTKTKDGKTLYWATCNLCESGFVSSPEEYGDYFAWGETETYYSSQNPLAWKSDKTSGYAWASYKWFKGTLYKMTKYCPSDKADFWDGVGSPDNKTVLELKDDVANVKLGGKWRMPTDEEWTELRTKCTWTTQNGVNGRLFTVTATNGNSIFLPAAGYRSGTSHRYVGTYGYYWSSSLYTDDPNRAWFVGVSSSEVGRSNIFRFYGKSVRPVSE